MATNQEQFEVLAAEANYHQRYAQDIQNQMQALNQVEAEMDRTLQALASLKDGKSSMFNIGSGVFVRGELKQVNRLMLNVGANVMVEKDPAGATEFLNEKKKELADARQELLQSMHAISSRLKEIDDEARRILKSERRE
ncbi:Prefoldin subunit alpha [uncultured archaeon]|nr:Prefoldin subunit alpha [uncultured archaeon]